MRSEDRQRPDITRRSAMATMTTLATGLVSNVPGAQVLADLDAAGAWAKASGIIRPIPLTSSVI